MISNPQVLNVIKPAVRPSGFGDESFNRVRPLLMIVIYDLIIGFNSETFTFYVNHTILRKVRCLPEFLSSCNKTVEVPSNVDVAVKRSRMS